jgi:hypothetical protein
LSVEEGMVRGQPGGRRGCAHHPRGLRGHERLKFHLTKGTAERNKKDIDEIAEPERYFFRGPVSWTIRTYSKFMHLPATYSSRGSNFTREGGSMSDGTT